MAHCNMESVSLLTVKLHSGGNRVCTKRTPKTTFVKFFTLYYIAIIYRLDARCELVDRLFGRLFCDSIV